MTQRKGRSRFCSLPEKNAVNVQLGILKEEFELAERSVAGSALVSQFHTLATKHEQAAGIERAHPGELVVEIDSEKHTLPLILWEEAEELSRGGSYSAYKRKLEKEQLERLQALTGDAVLERLWSFVDPKQLACQNTHGSVEALLPPPQKGRPGIVAPEKAGAEVIARKRPDTVELAPELLEEMREFAAGYGFTHTQAEAMLTSLGTLREWMTPRLDELKPGQVVWFARSVDYKPRWGQTTVDTLVPVVVTLYTPEELKTTTTSRQRFKFQEMKRLARITSEAYTQDAVFTQIDLELMMKRSSQYIKKLLELYKERYQMWLPTAGTVLDMGRCTTHKREAVELALEGVNTKTIARRLFHSEEAIDRYVGQYEKVVLLCRKYSAHPHDIAYLLNCSETLVEEYLKLVEKFEPDKTQSQPGQEDADNLRYG